MASGRRTIADIDAATRRLRAEEKQKADALEARNSARMALLNRRTALYRELAQDRVESALSDGVIDEADQVSAKVAALLKARSRSIDALKGRAAGLEDDHAEALAKLETTAEDIAELEEQLDAAAEAARVALMADPVFAAKVAEAEASRATLDRARTKAESAQQDRAAKGKAYESDPLFMYLWRRGYRQSGYDPNALIRLGDDWVADLVGYQEARANYAVLLEIPERLTEHCERLATALETLDADIASTVAAQVAEKSDLDLAYALKSARAREETQKEALEALDAERAEVAGLLNRYAEGADDAYTEALALSAAFLERETYAALRREARATPERSDDALVEEISGLTREINTAESDINSLKDELKALSRRRGALVEAGARMRRARYDDPASVFEPDETMGNLLELLVRGAITAAEYYMRSQRGHKWRSRSGDGYRKRGGFPPFGGGWSGGGRGRSGRGGFSTGGGF